MAKNLCAHNWGHMVASKQQIFFGFLPLNLISFQDLEKNFKVVHEVVSTTVTWLQVSCDNSQYVTTLDHINNNFAAQVIN